MTPETAAQMVEELAWAIARDLSVHHYGLTPPVQIANETPREVGIILKHIKSLGDYRTRMEWLHDCSTGQTDTEGYEWGIYRVKWENGQAARVWQTNSDFSDLDAEIKRETGVELSEVHATRAKEKAELERKLEEAQRDIGTYQRRIETLLKQIDDLNQAYIDEHI